MGTAGPGESVTAVHTWSVCSISGAGRFSALSLLPLVWSQSGCYYGIRADALQPCKPEADEGFLRLYLCPSLLLLLTLFCLLSLSLSLFHAPSLRVRERDSTPPCLLIFFPTPPPFSLSPSLSPCCVSAVGFIPTAGNDIVRRAGNLSNAGICPTCV